MAQNEELNFSARSNRMGTKNSQLGIFSEILTDSEIEQVL